jgi:hypothetical protein
MIMRTIEYLIVTTMGAALAIWVANSVVASVAASFTATARLIGG